MGLLKRPEQRDARRKMLHDVMELAATFFESTLESTLASRAGAEQVLKASGLAQQ